jgi:serine-type D-Ala-D-Ala carboxypeptidase/endopeptidase (penicillin-binding protein 4)
MRTEPTPHALSCIDTHGTTPARNLATPRRRVVLAALATLVPPSAWPRGPEAAPALPPQVRQALRAAQIPEDALSVVIEEAGGTRTLLSHRPREPVNPASLAKLITTYAALDLLGPSWQWNTPLYAEGPVRDGVLDGHLYIQGRGDPRLVVERLWQALRRIQQSGVREIRGDIVLDRSAFAPTGMAPGDFDGDPARPYNVQPDALLLNFHVSTWSFLPDPGRRVARVFSDTDGPLASAAMGSVPLADGACGDWRTALQAQPIGPGWRFDGRYPASCGEQSWPLADPEPASYGHRLIATLWREIGGRLGGRVRDGTVPAGLTPTLEMRSPPLAEVVRDINKFSNNVMAQQLFLTLARERTPDAPAVMAAARQTLARWVTDRIGEPAPGELVIDNGSGLSRDARVTTRWLAHLLQHAWSSPVMPEFVASLPVTGLDGTLRRSRATAGRAHLKTGSLRDVNGLAGYVLGDDARRWVFVAIVHHPRAGAARPALDALVQWSLQGGAVSR